MALIYANYDIIIIVNTIIFLCILLILLMYFFIYFFHHLRATFSFLTILLIKIFP